MGTDGAFVVDPGGVDEAGVDDLRDEFVAGPVGQGYGLGLEVDGGGAGDALAAADFGDAAVDEGAGGKQDAAFAEDGLGERGGEGGAFGGGVGGDALAEAGFEEGPGGELVGGAFDAGDDVGVGVEGGAGGGDGRGDDGDGGGGVGDGRVVAGRLGARLERGSGARLVGGWIGGGGRRGFLGRVGLVGDGLGVADAGGLGEGGGGGNEEEQSGEAAVLVHGTPCPAAVALGTCDFTSVVDAAVCGGRIGRGEPMS